MAKIDYKFKSVKFPKNVIDQIEKMAAEEKRSFSSQALIIIERELDRRNDIEAGNTQIDPSIIAGRK